MPQSASPTADGLPKWLVVLGSVAIIGHLGAVAVAALAAPSGPWPNLMGQTEFMPPPFAANINQVTLPNYLKHIKLASTYHFATNRPGIPGVLFEVKLKDDQGELLKDADGQEIKFRFPDPNANPWVRHRQWVLAQGVGNDIPVQPPQSEVIPGPNQVAPTVTIWEDADSTGQRLRLKTVPQHLVSRDRPVFQPSEWSMLMARSYARYLCRATGASKAEVSRHHQDPISPMILFDMPAGSNDVTISNFGEFSR